MKKWLSISILLGIVIRTVLAISTYHPDLGAFTLASKYIIGEGKLLTFYDTVSTKDKNGNPKLNVDDTVFNYQPLAYLIPSILYLPFGSTIDQYGALVRDQKYVSENPSWFNFQLLIFKYPMILADLALLWLIPKFFGQKRQKNIATIFWALNPIAIYVSSMMGQVDIIIAFLITFGLYLFKEEKYYQSVFSIALSSLIKPVGIILIPLLTLQHYRRKKNFPFSLGLFLAGFGAYFLGIFPYLQSVSYRYYALYAEQISKSTHAGISIASGNTIPFFFIFYTLIGVLVWKGRMKLQTGVGLALLSSLVFSHFHPQWLVWIMPWLVIRTVHLSDHFLYFAVLFCWLIILFSFDSSLHLQMLLHSTATLPPKLTSSSYFAELVLMARAGLIASFLWFIYDED